MSSITAQQLFYDCYADAGMIQLEQTGLNPDQVAECQQLFNRMIDSWQLDGWMCSHVARLLFPLLPYGGPAGIYTVGPNGDFDPAQGTTLAGVVGQIASNYPVRIERAGAVVTTQPNYQGPPEFPIRMLSLDEYQDWILKQQTSNWPWCAWYEPAFENSGGLGILHLLYVPTDGNYIALYLEETLAQIDATQDQTLQFRPGYYDLIASNMAVRIAARHPKTAVLADSTKELARSSMSLVRMANHRPTSRGNDFTGGGDRTRSSIYSGNRYGQ
jgi:hypothetical protein